MIFTEDERAKYIITLQNHARLAKQSFGATFESPYYHIINIVTGPSNVEAIRSSIANNAKIANLIRKTMSDRDDDYMAVETASLIVAIWDANFYFLARYTQ
jgi:hypothetical protein